MKIMKLSKSVITLASIVIVCFVPGQTVAQADQKEHPQRSILEVGFKSPPDSTRPYTWWHWVNGNISKDGITKDLEAMKAVGIGGFQLFDASVGIPRGPVLHNSKEYYCFELCKTQCKTDPTCTGFTISNVSWWYCNIFVSTATVTAARTVPRA